jgi:hypothetical protein
MEHVVDAELRVLEAKGEMAGPPEQVEAPEIAQEGLATLGDHPKPANEGHLKTGQRDS